jgi:hypothetical protein
MTLAIIIPLLGDVIGANPKKVSDPDPYLPKQLSRRWKLYRLAIGWLQAPQGQEN